MLMKNKHATSCHELCYKPDMKSCSDFESTRFQLLFIHSVPMASDIPLSLWGDSSLTDSDLLLDLGDRLLDELDDEDEGSSGDRRCFFVTMTGSLIVFELIR